MPHSRNAWTTTQFSPALRVGAGLAVLALHAAVIGALFMAPAQPPQIEEPEAVMVRFVEVGPEPQEAEAEPAPEPPAPVVEPEPEPVVEPEPEPEPEPVIEPEPEPEPVVEPEPEIVPPPVPEAPKLEPKPEPKPKPKPTPKPKPEPKPQPKPQPKPPVEQPPATPPSGNPQGAAKPQGPQQGPPPDQPRMIGRVDFMGQRPMPVYPRASQLRREQGRVMVRVLINPQGGVDKASIQRSSGHDRLDQAALEAARKARFKPYTENGIAYPAMADIPFDFVMRN